MLCSYYFKNLMIKYLLENTLYDYLITETREKSPKLRYILGAMLLLNMLK